MFALRPLQSFVSETAQIRMAGDPVEFLLGRFGLGALVALRLLVGALTWVGAYLKVLLIDMLEVVLSRLGLACLRLDFAHHVTKP